jgi:hypothetical protein
MAIAKKPTPPNPPEDKSVQILVADTLFQRWERTRIALGYKTIQDTIKLAMEKLMAEDGIRLANDN